MAVAAKITTDEENFIVQTAKTRPETLGRPFTHWSIRKLRDYLGDDPDRVVRIGRERLRRLLARHKITFQWDQDLEGVQRPRQGTGVDRAARPAARQRARTQRVKSPRPAGLLAATPLSSRARS